MSKLWKKTDGTEIEISEMNNGYLINAYKLTKRRMQPSIFGDEVSKDEIALRSEITKRGLDVPTSYDRAGRINKIRRPQTNPPCSKCGEKNPRIYHKRNCPKTKTYQFRDKKNNIPNLL